MSLFQQKLVVFREYYSRDFQAHTYSIGNVVNILLWLIIIVVPLDILMQNQGK